METLVIHPDDPSTDFLEEIYIDKEWTVVRSYLTRHETMRLIDEHDRIVMLGHGCPDGLFGDYDMAIDDFMADLLREKEQCVSIWCHAKSFFERHRLRGFYTDMFISEVYEAQYNNVFATQRQVDDSNLSFAIAFGAAVDGDNILQDTLDGYDVESGVADFNRARLYYRT